MVNKAHITRKWYMHIALQCNVGAIPMFQQVARQYKSVIKYHSFQKEKKKELILR